MCDVVVVLDGCGDAVDVDGGLKNEVDSLPRLGSGSDVGWTNWMLRPLAAAPV